MVLGVAGVILRTNDTQNNITRFWVSFIFNVRIKLILHCNDAEAEGGNDTQYKDTQNNKSMLSVRISHFADCHETKGGEASQYSQQGHSE